MALSSLLVSQRRHSAAYVIVYTFQHLVRTLAELRPGLDSLGQGHMHVTLMLASQSSSNGSSSVPVAPDYSTTLQFSACLHDIGGLQATPPRSA